MSDGTARLSEVCTFRHGGTPSKANPSYWGGDIPWISPKDMKSSLLMSSEDTITNAGVLGSATSVVPEGSILVVARSGILAHTLPVARAGRSLSFNQDIKAIQVSNNRVLGEYVYWFLRSKEHDVLTRGVKKGATVHSLQSGFLESLEIPLRAIHEQRRIVDLLSRTENIVWMRREAERKAKEFIPALFLDMFGDPATNPKGWTEASLAQVIAEFRYGSSQKSSVNGDPVLRIPNVVGGNVDIRDLKFLNASDSDRRRYSLASGDILFVRTNGNPDYVGRCAVFEPPTDQRWLYASYLIRGRPLPDAIDPQFLQVQLSSVEGRRRLRERARTAAGQYNINVEGLRSIRINLPPLDRQRVFAGLVRQTKEISAGLATASAVADTTFRSLLAAVFGAAA